MSRAACNVILRRWGAEVTGRVLSIGSSDDQDKTGGTYRSYFPKAASYQTSEPAKGSGCDLVVDARCMPGIPDGVYDAIFAAGVLEHIDAKEQAVAECWRVLASNGLFLVGVPFHQPLHRVPQDFWRFTEHGLRYLLRDFTIEALEAVGPAEHPYTYLAKARKHVH